MTAKAHGRSGRPWRELRLRVLAEEPYCQIRGPRCTGVSTQVDHVVALSIAPELAHERSNLRGACAPCNARGGARMTNAGRNGQTYRPPSRLGHLYPPGHPEVGACPWSSAAPNRLCLSACQGGSGGLMPIGCQRVTALPM